ncbi:myrcene synthase, chloroplastic-like [Neltuma alba]|uniref:myrcene synthase, chloroplastic-like n=1 Tax=Neltuma alba TaxID=207710 RepID=UPI0010A517CD|nr:myrcene synthase, chloroplastic-like [Prosopis alba]
MVENFIGVGVAFQPKFGYFRRVVSKVFAVITIIDDIWDVNAIDELPDYMKICFLALNNFVNEVAFDFLKENGRNIILHIKKVWVDLCKSDLVEATCSTNKQDSIRFEEYSNVICYVLTIFRLVNDLGIAKREKVTGDIPKSVECYMNETGASEAKARRQINSLICETWKEMNKEVSNSSCSGSFMEVAVNLVRMCMCEYQHGDGHIVQDDETKKRIISLFCQPIA